MLEIKNLTVKDKYKNELLSDVSINVIEKTITTLVGVSGAGKTTLAKVILGILNEDLLLSGSIYLNGHEISKLTKKEYRKMCGKEIAFIPQLPMRAFDERMKIGKQMTELYMTNLRVNKTEAIKMAKKNLNYVNLEDERVLNSYPFELSGGMLQRVIIAIVLGLSPNYIVADEPTSALDEYNTSLFLKLIEENFKDKGILLITHNLDIIKKKTDYCYVMEQGKIIEEGNNKDVFENCKKSWTQKIVQLSAKKEDLEGYWQWNK
ncbi:ABC transporter ATP-binding protein [Filifactor alocis]|uniref:ATP-binding cassette domain-containing protein n=1 Tax=Filifactor alocis TaxID=143361 RepID=UPI0010E215DE|nr:peptide/nickel transport system ATP-binding protein [Streptococcus pneumoniae]